MLWCRHFSKLFACVRSCKPHKSPVSYRYYPLQYIEKETMAKTTKITYIKLLVPRWVSIPSRLTPASTFYWYSNWVLLRYTALAALLCILVFPCLFVNSLMESKVFSIYFLFINCPIWFSFLSFSFLISFLSVSSFPFLSFVCFWTDNFHEMAHVQVFCSLARREPFSSILCCSAL